MEGKIKKTKVEVEGTIVSFSETELVLIVAGQEVVITLDASTKVKGDLEEGSWVEVEAVAEDSVFLATEIEVEAEEKAAERAREAEEKAAERAREAEEKAAERD
ncbi:hypothetical protein ES703_43930 [subsurface metagenome]